MKKIAECRLRIAEIKKKVKPRNVSFKSEIKDGGFTLIELMAVIAIILILASIMIPNIVKNVEQGRKAKATADIDILIKAVSLFQIDNGNLPTDLGKLWDTGVGGPYISTDEAKSLETPWGGSYNIRSTPGSGSYTIEATGSEATTIKVTKTITFE